MHLTIEDFETYLSTDDISAKTLAAIEPIQLHLDSCEQCRKTLSHLNIVYHTISEESLGSSVALLNHEPTVRRGLVFTVIYQKLYNALPQEQEALRKLIADFFQKRYDTYCIDELRILPSEPPIPFFKKPVPPEPESKSSETEDRNILDYATLRERLKKEAPSVPSGGFYAAMIVGPKEFSGPSCDHRYDGKELTVSVFRQVPVSYMILQPKQGLELPQVQPAVYDGQRECYKAVFSLETPSKAYQVLIF